MRTRLVSVAVVLSVLVPPPIHAQERFSFFLASTPESVERLLTLAKLRDDDVVIDLGSGDGLIPLTAARMNPRLRGRGVDIDAKLVDESNQRAKREGVADRVRFELRNAFDADLREATVITMWLFPELMRLLRPIILERARPGTRVLTSTWELGSWQADEVNRDGVPIYLYVVPARVAGAWDWELTVAGKRVPYSSLIEQRFQNIEGAARAGNRREVLQDAALRGDHIKFTLAITLDGLGLTQHQFEGKVNGERIDGTVTVTPLDKSPTKLPWIARRVARSKYLAPTGLPPLPLQKKTAR
jgi:Methyltransferase domain